MRTSMMPTGSEAFIDLGNVINVLLVEDSVSDILLVERMLDHAPNGDYYAFTETHRLVEAFHMLRRQEFDLILLDLNLPDVAGADAVKVLHDERPEIPIIVYSGLEDMKMKYEALRSGATRYIVKGETSSMDLHHIMESVIYRNI